MIEVELIKPESISYRTLRKFILVKLSDYGEPLRWAITDSNRSHLKVEAVIISKT